MAAQHIIAAIKTGQNMYDKLPCNNLCYRFNSDSTQKAVENYTQNPDTNPRKNILFFPVNLLHNR